MKYLLDTHTLIWLSEKSPKLSRRVQELFVDRKNSIYISPASLWEIAIKVSLGKLELRSTYREFLNNVKSSDFEMLQIKDDYLEKLPDLPFVHRDPFDRLLIVTALSEGLTIITVDDNIQRYSVPCIW
jgi:PIN domain nuclease of toxin-antitoxin system